MLINQFDVFYKNVLNYFHLKIINIRKYFNFVIVEIIIFLLLMVVSFIDKKNCSIYDLLYLYININKN